VRTVDRWVGLALALLGMAANDPGDDDHAVLESLRRKFAESKPNNVLTVSGERKETDETDE
jgi:hypothetical protein